MSIKKTKLISLIFYFRYHELDSDVYIHRQPTARRASSNKHSKLDDQIKTSFIFIMKYRNNLECFSLIVISSGTVFRKGPYTRIAEAVFLK